MSSSLRQELITRAVAGAPNEVGGLLGERDGILGIAEPYLSDARGPAMLAVSNEVANATRTRLIKAGFRPAGEYHSHPRDRAVPSLDDCVSMRPGEPMIIIGLSGRACPEVRAWRRSGFCGEEIPIIPERAS